MFRPDRLAPTLTESFTRASSNGYPRGWTQAHAIEFYSESPRKLDSLVEIANAQIRENSDQGNRIISSLGNHLDDFSTRLTLEIHEQTDQLVNVIQNSAADIASAIDNAADRICANLELITWQIQQISNQLDTLIYLTQYKRRTEATELLQQATRHMQAGNYNDAKERLLRAYELDNTDYQVLYNLGLVSIHLDLGSEAIDYFHRAARVPDNLSNQAIAKALFSEARVHFATNQPEKALRLIEECIGLRNSSKDLLYASIYSFHCGQDQGAREFLRRSVATKTIEFSVAAIHEELDPFRQVVLAILRDIDAEANKHFNEAYHLYTSMRQSHLDELAASNSFPQLKIIMDQANLIASKQTNELSFTSRVTFVNIIDNLQNCANETTSILNLKNEIKSLLTKQNALASSIVSVNKSPEFKTDVSGGVIYAAVGLLWFLGNRIFVSGEIHSIGLIVTAIFWPFFGLMAGIIALISALFNTDSVVAKDSKIAVACLLASIAIVWFVTDLRKTNANVKNTERFHRKDELENQRSQIRGEITSKSELINVFMTNAINKMQSIHTGFRQLNS